MNGTFLDDERCVDLLIQEATTGLDEAEATELDGLLARYPDARRGAFEPAAAAVALAARLPVEPLPAKLCARLLTQGEAQLGVHGVEKIADIAVARRARDEAATGVVPARRRPGALSWWATAAAVMIAIAGWYPRLFPPSAPSAADLRAQLLATGPGVVHWEFTPTSDPDGAGASGDVVFDRTSQRGYMHLHNLKPNERRLVEYQLWIFDSTRDDRYPVDGGVFDIPAGSTDVVVPITARVRVGAPALFAVTVERAGGVVVSGREHIVVVAKPTHT